MTTLTEAVARYYFKLLAIKDEYEVARLYAETDFAARVAAQFEGDYKLTFHLAPPVFNKPDPVTGEAKKSVYGPWMMRAFGVLAKLRRFRGTPLDIFGKTAERRMERALLGEYEALVAETLGRAGAAQSRARRRARAGSRAHPRVRPREGSARGRGEEEGSGAPGGLPLGDARRTKDDGARRRLNPRQGPTQAAVLARFPSWGISQSVGGAGSCVTGGGRVSIHGVDLPSPAGRSAARRSRTS